ncbi:MAG: Uncharcterized protein, DUF927 family [Candidatus Nitrotoga sp. SPKER]|nr:MAG: Uncharcterized protein, DUF927 family [Candidatus Nitrotoga sp. SPKER]
MEKGEVPNNKGKTGQPLTKHDPIQAGARQMQKSPFFETRTAVEPQALVPVAHSSTTDETPQSELSRASVSSSESIGQVAKDFTVDPSGVWYAGKFDRNGKRKQPEWICSYLKPVALTRDQSGHNWGYELEIKDKLGTIKRCIMPARLLSGDGGEYRGMLLSMGVQISSTREARVLLTRYIQTSDPQAYAVCTDRCGWQDRAYVTTGKTYGDYDERIVYQRDIPIEDLFKASGTVKQWCDGLGAMCIGNSRLVFSAACAFAAPLLPWADQEGGGFHLLGNSSNGKTAAQRLASSVNGGSNYMQSWRATDNALESTAAIFNHALLVLNELGQSDPRTVGETAYMLGNGQGKGRMTRIGTSRPQLFWLLIWLSSGEVKLSDHVLDGQKRTRPGQDVRMADIPADAGKGLGLFENLHGYADGKAFANRIEYLAKINYGASGDAWLVALTANTETLKAKVRPRIDALATKMIPKNSSGQVGRVATRFALVGVAGEIATEMGLTGWPVGESKRSAIICFNAWLEARGDQGDGEIIAMLRKVRRFLETNGESRFSMWHRVGDDNAPKTLLKAGVRRMVNAHGEPIKSNNHPAAEYAEKMSLIQVEEVSFEYFILPETFRSEVCQSFDYKAVCRALLDHGCLLPGNGRTFDCKQRLPGIGNVWVYRIPPAIFELDL